MRHYREGARIYIFGFSRGAYTARFLNEMLDYVGLLGPDNEEVIPFVWDAFAAWKLARNNGRKGEKKAAYSVLKQCRETLSRPISRVHFLGMFDAVNSVAEFEVNIDRMPSTRIVRHAMSIDERRIKFRPVLLRSHKDDNIRHTTERVKSSPAASPRDSQTTKADEEKSTKDASHGDVSHTSPGHGPSDIPEKSAGNDNAHDNNHLDIEAHENDDDDDGLQDAEEIWFPGGHGDVGGGWNPAPGELWPLSHAPLVWMVQEAVRAGLQFDREKLRQHECIEDSSSSSEHATSPETSQSHKGKRYLDALHIGGTKGKIHDLLQYGHGLPFRSVFSWRLLEYLPLRRMELQIDGDWKAARWPPPHGEPRDLPMNARIHVSAIQRMKSDPSYRPSNLTGGLQERNGNTGGAGAAASGGWGWVIGEHEGDPVRESYIRERNSKYAM